MKVINKIGVFPLMLGVLILGIGMALASGYGSPMHDGVAPNPPSGTAGGDINMGGNSFTVTASGNIHLANDAGVYWGNGIDMLAEYRNASTDWCLTQDDSDGVGTPADVLCFKDASPYAHFAQEHVVIGDSSGANGVLLDSGRTAGYLSVRKSNDGAWGSVDTNVFYAYSQYQLASAGYVSWYARSTLGSSADGILEITNGALGQGIRIDTTTDTLLMLGDQAGGELVTSVGRQLAEAPDAPVTCNATSEGAFQYIKDTNDGGAGMVCICARTDDSAYDWRDIGDIAGTACSKF